MEHEICTCSDKITVREDSYGQANLSRRENAKKSTISHFDLLQKSKFFNPPCCFCRGIAIFF